MKLHTYTSSNSFSTEQTLTGPLASASLDLIEAGDIVATASDASASEGIQWATNAEFSHAILGLKNGLAVDAMPGVGVTRGVLSEKLRGVSRVAVFRHRTATLSQRAFAANWAAAQIGRGYDNVGAARVGLQPGARTFPLRLTPVGHALSVIDEMAGLVSDEWHDRSFFCSELIFRAYEVAQVPIVSGRPHVSGPGALRRVSTLRCVGEFSHAS